MKRLQKIISFNTKQQKYSVVQLALRFHYSCIKAQKDDNNISFLSPYSRNRCYNGDKWGFPSILNVKNGSIHNNADIVHNKSITILHVAICPLIFKNHTLHSFFIKFWIKTAYFRNDTLYNPKYQNMNSNRYLILPYTYYQSDFALSYYLYEEAEFGWHSFRNRYFPTSRKYAT